MGELPCLKVAYNMRQFAGVTGNGSYQWYFDEVLRNDPGTKMEFYNYGWWDLSFDDMMYRHDYPNVEAVPPRDIDTLRWFKGIGWAALQVRQDDPQQHIQFILKSLSVSNILSLSIPSMHPAQYRCNGCCMPIRLWSLASHRFAIPGSKQDSMVSSSGRSPGRLP